MPKTINGIIPDKSVVKEMMENYGQVVKKPKKVNTKPAFETRRKRTK